MSALHPDKISRAVSPGPGHRFVAVGELLRAGDQFYGRDGRWHATTSTWRPCPMRQRYRRPVPAAPRKAVAS